jgi:hypothetical protein
MPPEGAGKMSFYVDPAGLSPLQYLAKLKTAIGDEFKYKILGKNDVLFQQLMRALPNERFEAVRLARTGAAIIVQKHGESTAPHSVKLTAEAQGRFLYKAAKEVYDVRQSAEPKKLATALSALSKELETAVNNYVAAGNENPEEQRDRAFETNAKLIHDKLKLVATTLKPRLKAVLQYYNTSLVAAEKSLANVKAALAGFTPGAPAAPLTVPPDDSGSTVDITV